MSEQLTLELEEITDPKSRRAKKPHNENTKEWHDCCDTFQKAAVKYAANCGIEASHIKNDTNKDKSVSIKIDRSLIAKLFPNPVISVAFSMGKFNKYAPNCDFLPIKSPEGYGKISVDSSVALEMLEKSILDYVPSYTFGCCHRYKECSHAKQCIHPDLFYAKSCQYRKNLEAGRIFYN